MTNNTLTIEITWRPRNSWQALRLLERVARHACQAEGFNAGMLSVAVVGARAMATLHQQYAGIAGPTDVLTFDLGSDHAANRIDAEIVVCTDVAQRNAAKRSATLATARAELALYVVHGVLHLAGYTDKTDPGYTQMHAREDALLAQLGLGPVFSAPSGRRLR